MLEEFNIKSDDIFPICIIATMSSGKSTFINAILGEEVLPEKNEACTARALAVINSSVPGTPNAFIIKKDHSKGYVGLYDRLTMEKINADETVKDVLIKMNIPYIKNINKPFVFIDTPGVNNSEDILHEERTKAVLSRMDRGIIVYLLNATQLATNDDALLLQMVLKHVKENPQVKIYFVLNKIDMLDEDKESIKETIKIAESYINSFGMEDSVIYPLSALSAKVLRLKLGNKYMTKTEHRYLTEAYKYYKATERNMLQYASPYNMSGNSFYIDGEEITEYGLKRAIENTGITEIEKQIMNFAIQSMDNIEINFNSSGYTEWEGVYSKKRKAKNIAGYKGRVNWICKSCRQVNGMEDCCINCGKHNITWAKV